MLLHSVATGLVLKTARTVLATKPATVAALLFAVHPVHTEAVAGIVGRADITACIFYLLSFITYTNHIKVREQKIKHTTICNEDKSKVVSKIKCSRNSSVYDNRRQFSEYCSCQQRIMKNKSPGFGNGLKLGHITAKTNSVSISRKVIQWFYLCLSVLLAACSMLCKETGITVLIVCVIYDFLHQLRCSKIKLVSVNFHYKHFLYNLRTKETVFGSYFFTILSETTSKHMQNVHPHHTTMTFYMFYFILEVQVSKYFLDNFPCFQH